MRLGDAASYTTRAGLVVSLRPRAGGDGWNVVRDGVIVYSVARDGRCGCGEQQCDMDVIAYAISDIPLDPEALECV